MTRCICYCIILVFFPEMTDTLIAAQAFVFFLAGFETSSSTISNTLYEMALNPSIQDRLREEIVEELKKHNGDMTYESVKGMKYLHRIFCGIVIIIFWKIANSVVLSIFHVYTLLYGIYYAETLRKYPPAGVLQRSSSEPYTFAGTKVTIPKNTSLLIPVYAIHRDPQIYPEPDKFEPDRFDEETIKQRHPSFYLPFGDGPRNCIGRYS